VTARAYRLEAVPVDFLHLSQENVVAAGGLDMDACLATIDETLVLHHRGETVLPQKAALHWSDELDTDEKLGRIMAMPAYVGGSIAMAGIKWIPSVPQNPARGLPRGIGVVLLSDPETGLPVCFMDGTVVSAMRTGAVSGLAARVLAVEGASVLALYGAGVQSRTQLAGLERCLPALEEIRLYDPSRSQTDAFVASEQDGRPPIVVLDDPREAARGAHVVVPATMAPAPFFTSDWFEPGMLLVSVSSHDPALDALAAADLLVTDDFTHETYHPSRPLARGKAAGIVREENVVSLGAILAGDHPGRRTADERILVSPVGLGIEDVAWATAVYRRAVDMGLGARQRLWETPIWT
jgi:N-[(2S)-2-amino-2-carboxyethyl]-L-glutamate dehydrogenase